MILRCCKNIDLVARVQLAARTTQPVHLNSFQLELYLKTLCRAAHDLGEGYLDEIDAWLRLCEEAWHPSSSQNLFPSISIIIGKTREINASLRILKDASVSQGREWDVYVSCPAADHWICR